MNKNKVKLSICGSEYVLVAEDCEEYILAVGDQVHNSMQEILSKNVKLSISMAAVLTALSFCDQENKARRATEDIRQQMKGYLSETDLMREMTQRDGLEIGRLQGKIAQLEEQICELNARLKESQLRERKMEVKQNIRRSKELAKENMTFALADCEAPGQAYEFLPFNGTFTGAITATSEENTV